ncbi:BTB/POZ domain-containing protein [Hirsutella rhossiliensis]|uniref:BTB/POZ domain-containing protein n=1 Tax=Hirsutella rhossiliensis TaxID=111463 RepID=A0A9P8MQ13_9HYPO|nr:BTB/POZ domain-containing protein [Hirsutella rhossiliensis]KAH0958394.1 BTB/POZ domain-containing protein [Hirsutella rhossiliensis]
MGSRPRKELMLSLAKLYNLGTYSDFTITCGSAEYRVHKAIVCPRSRFFAAACNDAFQEGHNGVVNLPEDDPRIVRLMVYFFYHLTYPAVSLDDADTAAARQHAFLEKVHHLRVHAMVYALAEKYSVDGLKDLAMRKFEQEVGKHWDSDDFIQAAEYAYTSTVEGDRGLRNLVVKTFEEHHSLLRKEDAKAMVKRVESLAYDLLMAFHMIMRVITYDPPANTPKMDEY